MIIDTTNTFVATIQELGLLEGSRLSALPTLAERHATPRALGRYLIDEGWLTAFQVNQVLQGRGENLRLGPYLLLERIGAGGMGEVFKALHNRLRRLVALKVIQREQMAEPVAKQRFLREAEAVARLSHPNIVTVFDAGEVGETHYLAMELIEGSDLGRLVHQAGPLPIGLACDCIRQAALGLQHAHERGIIHRDIKPSNLLITSTAPIDESGLARPEQYLGGLVKILDLGLIRWHSPDQERAEEPLTRQGVVIGTMDYLAPEQAMSPQTVDCRADIYALGCTLYHLLTGQPPFPGGLPLEKILKHQSEEPKPVSDFRSDVPADLEAVLRQMMSKQTGSRQGTAAEVAAALGAIGARYPVAAPGAPAVPLHLPGTDEPTKIVDAGIGGKPPDTLRNGAGATAAGRWPHQLVWGGVALVALIGLVVATWTMLPPRPPGRIPVPAFPEGMALAEYVPAECVGVATFRPRDIARTKAGREHLGWVSGMLRSKLPHLPGIDDQPLEELRVMFTRKDPRPVLLVRGELHTAPYRDGASGLKCDAEGVFSSDKGGLFLGPAPPYLVVSYRREAVLEALRHAREPAKSGLADARLQELLASSRDSQLFHVAGVLDGLRTVPLAPEWERVLRPIFTRGEAIHGQLLVEEEVVRLRLTIHVAKESVERLHTAVQAARGVIQDANARAWQPELVRNWSALLPLLSMSRVTRGEGQVVVECWLPGGHPPNAK